MSKITLGKLSTIHQLSCAMALDSMEWVGTILLLHVTWTVDYTPLVATPIYLPGQRQHSRSPLFLVSCHVSSCICSSSKDHLCHYLMNKTKEDLHKI